MSEIISGKNRWSCHIDKISCDIDINTENEISILFHFFYKS